MGKIGREWGKWEIVGFWEGKVGERLGKGGKRLSEKWAKIEATERGREGEDHFVELGSQSEVSEGKGKRIDALVEISA